MRLHRAFSRWRAPKKRTPSRIGTVEPIGWRARPGAAGPSRYESGDGDPNYPVIDGPHYIDVLGALHRLIEPDWYLEIGTFRGASLQLARHNVVAVDPEFSLRNFDLGPARHGHFLQMTSDEFFEEGFLATNCIAVDMAFLDGMHLFEYLLRDFIHAEERASARALYILHDCLPTSNAMVDREWNTAKTSAWTGDVWKTLLALIAFRPDLTINILDAWPTGLVTIEGLNPHDNRLEKAYEEIVARYEKLSLSEYGIGRYYGKFKIQSSHRFIETRR